METQPKLLEYENVVPNPIFMPKHRHLILSLSWNAEIFTNRLYKNVENRSFNTQQSQTQLYSKMIQSRSDS